MDGRTRLIVGFACPYRKRRVLRAAQVVNLSSAPTVNGKALEITVTNGVVRVNGVQVVTTDVLASNGVIHVIDAVLIP